MRSVTGEPAPAGRDTAPDPVPSSVGSRPPVHPDCRWCGGPSAWSWSLRGPSLPDVPAGAGGAELRVCDACQTLSLAGDDAAVLARSITALTAGMTYPVAVDFLREQEARSVADWVARRTTARAVEPGSVAAGEAHR